MDSKTVAFLVAWLAVGAVLFGLLWQLFVRGVRDKGRGPDAP